MIVAAARRNDLPEYVTLSVQHRRRNTLMTSTFGVTIDSPATINRIALWEREQIEDAGDLILAVLLSYERAVTTSCN